MKKQLLLAAAAVTALVAAGSAHAASVSYRAGATGPFDASATPYVLAKELNFAAGITSTVGQFDTIVVANTPIPAGTYTVEFNFAGATINAAVPNTTVAAYTGLSAAVAAVGPSDVTGEVGFAQYNTTAVGASAPTLTLVSGGTVGSTTVTYTLQVPAGNTVTSIGVSPAMKVVGATSVTVGIRNQVGNAFYEPAVVQNLISVSTGNAFAARADGLITAADATTFGAGAGVDTRIDDGVLGNPFNTLTGSTVALLYQLGQTEVAVAGSANYNTITGTTGVAAANKDLIGTVVSLADITSVATNIQGALGGLTFTAVNSAGTTTGVAFPAGTATSKTVTSSANVDVTTVYATPTSVAATAAQLAPTDLPVSIQLTLGSVFAAQPAVTGSYETIQTDGITYVIPWVTSNSFGQITGSTSVIRVSNIGGFNVGGRVYGQLYNPTNINGVVTTSRSFNFGALGRGPTNSEVIIGSTELQNAFGDFGRGDLRLTVTDDQIALQDNGNIITPNGGAATVGDSSIVVKRVIRSANGSLTEMSVLAGSSDSVTNLPTQQGVNY